jgi:uncharacterized protein YbbK (DUF523 family)
MKKILVSACLLGERVRYDGREPTDIHPLLRDWRREGRLIALCPEVAGGLPVPRAPAEILVGDTAAVLAGTNQVVDVHGGDVTAEFMRGAGIALQMARSHGIRLAILKDGSPSCGSGAIRDGTFSGRRISGRGVTTLLLEQGGIRVFADTAVDAAAQWLARLEGR